MKVERMVSSGQIARQARMRSRVFSWAAGRRIAFNTAGEACWKGTSIYGSTLPPFMSPMTSSTCG